MAATLAEAMTELAISMFAVVGHDRDARVAYRLALDHAETLIGRDPDLYVRHIIEQWDGAHVTEGEAVDEYIRCIRKPEVRRTIGAEYRADQLDRHVFVDVLAELRDASVWLTVHPFPVSL